jgi:peptide subunit release factor RF-3
MVDATNANNRLPFVIPEPDDYDMDVIQLSQVLGEPILRGLPLLIFANKMDRTDSKTMLSLKEIAIRMGLPGISNRRWHIQGCSAMSGKYVHTCIYV